MGPKYTLNMQLYEATAKEEEIETGIFFSNVDSSLKLI
jgi:hypothetical protein